MKIKFLGAAQTVTGSKTQFEYRHQKYLVDCGLFQGPKEKRMLNWEQFYNAESIKSILLTHAHLDHSGYIPKIVKEGFKGMIHASTGTYDLCKILLRDAGHLQEEDARFANQTGYSHHKPALPLYDEIDAINSLNLFSTLPRDVWANLDQDLNFRFLRSGHIIGSSFVQLSFNVPNGVKLITFSGDLGNSRSLILKPPVSLIESDYLVLESTYGNRKQPRTDTAADLAKVVNRVVDRKGVLLIPAFSVGRTQEIIYLLRKLQDANKIPKLPVYLDSPMANHATDVFIDHPEDHLLQMKNGELQEPIQCHNYIPVKSADESMLLCMQEGPMIVISAAGMLTGGRIMHHLKHRLSNPENAVLFVGYQAEGTKGRLLQEGIQDLRIHHQTVPVEAEICTIESLSAHADADDILDWLRAMQRLPEMIFVNHGEPASAQALAKRIHEDLKVNVVVPKPDEEFHIGIDSYA